MITVNFSRSWMVFADGVEVTSSLFCVAVTELPELIVHVAPVHPGPDTLGAAGVMKPARATLTPEARKTIQRIAINLAARIVDSFLLWFPRFASRGDRCCLLNTHAACQSANLSSATAAGAPSRPSRIPAAEATRVREPPSERRAG